MISVWTSAQKDSTIREASVRDVTQPVEIVTGEIVADAQSVTPLESTTNKE